VLIFLQYEFIWTVIKNWTCKDSASSSVYMSCLDYSYDERDWRSSLRENHVNLLSHAILNAGFRNTRKNPPQGRRRRSGRKERKREAGGETDGVRSMEAKGDEQGCYCVVVWLNVLIPITTICPGSALLRALWPGHGKWDSGLSWYR